ncbi:MAG TPA: nuclear transport factor 2 family protein [Ktedonobacterales bacterium]
MTQQSAAATARTFSDAWTSGDFETAANVVAEDVVFDGPLGHTDGKAAYIEGLKGLSRFVGLTSANILAAYGDDTQALIMYELVTSNFGNLLCAKLLTFREGKIARDRLTFDSYTVRQVQAT